MKYYVALLFSAITLCAMAAEIDINGKFLKGMDGWLPVPKGVISEVKTNEKDRFQLKLDATGKKRGIMVYSRVYSAGSTGDKLTLSAVASGTGAGYVGIVCFDQGGNQANIVYRYFYPNKEMKKFTLPTVIPESRLKDRKGNVRKISKIRISFGVSPGSNILFSEVDAVPVEAENPGVKAPGKK